jgi:hypothetical protein
VIYALNACTVLIRSFNAPKIKSTYVMICIKMHAQC